MTIPEPLPLPYRPHHLRNLSHLYPKLCQLRQDDNLLHLDFFKKPVKLRIGFSCRYLFQHFKTDVDVIQQQAQLFDLVMGNQFKSTVPSCACRISDRPLTIGRFGEHGLRGARYRTVVLQRRERSHNRRQKRLSTNAVREVARVFLFKKRGFISRAGGEELFFPSKKQSIEEEPVVLHTSLGAEVEFER